MSRSLLLLLFLVVALDLSPGEAQTPGKVYRVGMILTSSPVTEMMGANPAHAPFRAFLHEMRGRGYVEGQNLVVERRSLEGRYERASDVVAELVRLKVEAIVTPTSSVARDAKRVTTTVPIVMAASRSPETSFAAPRSTWTGSSKAPSPATYPLSSRPSSS